jgi:hypothetical protein
LSTEMPAWRNGRPLPGGCGPRSRPGPDRTQVFRATVPIRLGRGFRAQADCSDPDTGDRGTAKKLDTPRNRGQPLITTFFDFVLFSGCPQLRDSMPCYDYAEIGGCPRLPVPDYGIPACWGNSPEKLDTDSLRKLTIGGRTPRQGPGQGLGTFLCGIGSKRARYSSGEQERVGSGA